MPDKILAAREMLSPSLADVTIARLASDSPVEVRGAVVAASEHVVEVAGLSAFATVGGVVELTDRGGSSLLGEVVGIRDGRVVVMGLQPLTNLGPGCAARLAKAVGEIRPSDDWLGRIFDGVGEPLDDGPPPSIGRRAYPLRASPPPASRRGLVAERIDTGVAAINTFATCCRGQRLGIFAGSGVGKTTLLGMLARNVSADALVIALVGERGKELSEFLERYLPAEVRRRAVVVMSTSDQTATLRRRAVLVAAAIAEKLRDDGLHVAFFLDSLTRYAMALREIGLVAGEPVGPSGYPASVFSELPKVIERLGPGEEGKAITAFLTVLVEGDDMNEPVADAVRGIVDGHLVLDRRIADGGRYPAIDIARSVSRAMPHCNDEGEGRLISEALRLEAVYQDIEDLYKLSMYKKGSNSDIDQAIDFHGRLEAMLAQPFGTVVDLGTGFEMLRSRLDGGQS